ncbi:MAG TPA: PepSY domain-containing protein [Phycisphaerales bacterium]|nr:PepSY domain-containing protein [Phycisphaerales bacterium]
MNPRRFHFFLGILTALPILAWGVSGFFLSLPPSVSKGVPYSVIESHRISITPSGVIEAVELHLGEPPELTSMSLEQRGDKAVYSAFGKKGAFLVDAVSGKVSKPPPPSRLTRWIRNAHFFNFAGSSRTTLLMLFSFLTVCLVVSGVALAFWQRIVKPGSCGQSPEQDPVLQTAE